MKLFVSPGRPDNLKLLAALEATGLRPQLQTVGQQERVVPFLTSPTLPALQLPGGEFVFSTNAICQYFFALSGKQPGDASNQWLEWEVTRLR
ncbi:methionine--tRNA ligase, cytoplasmic-like, partial [Mustelus asterias]